VATDRLPRACRSPARIDGTLVDSSSRLTSRPAQEHPHRVIAGVLSWVCGAQSTRRQQLRRPGCRSRS